MSLAPGTRLGPYEILAPLGAGGMGEVYRARDPRLGRDVAIKILPAHLATTPEARARFEREARAISQLNHPNICTLHDIGREGKTDYLVMEFLDGQTLAAQLTRGALPRAQALEYAVQIAHALARAHGEGIVHRDLKPGNVMLTGSGVKLLDFGLAKLTPATLPAAALSSLPTQESPITGQGAIVGTLAYMAPEQLEGKDVDARTDLFAFGALLYEMLTGRRAFEGATQASLITAIMSADPTPLTSLEPLTPPGLDRVVMKCLAKDPSARWQSAADLADELRWISTGSASSADRAVPAAVPRSRRVWPRVALVGGLMIAVALAVGVGWRLVRHREAPPSAGKAVGRITSLALKPLDDYSGDTNQAYLSDGMTEALCAALGNITALRVPGRSSVMRYKGGQKSIQEMARELNVDAIVEGSVQRAGNRILVTVQLIEAATDRHLWSTNFERDLGDFFKVQSEVARAIAAEVQVRLTPEDQARLARARTASPDAIEAYLRGMQIWWQWSGGNNMIEALHYFQKAIEIEPGYAPAHAGAALAYVFASTWNNVGLWSPREGVPKGKEAAQKAIGLDPMLADGYVAMGFARMSFDWDWDGAEKDFKKALELSPHSTLALDAYANFLLLARGRLDEAVAVLNRALASDPLSPALHSDLGVFYYMFGQFDRAIPEFRKALDLDSNFFWARLSLGWSHLLSGNTNEALAEFKAVAQTAPDEPWTQMALGYAYGVSGHRDEALHALAKLNQLAKTRYVPPSAQAWVYLGVSQKDVALDWLEKAYAERDAEMVFLKGVVDPALAPLRNEPRFQALLKKVQNGGRDP